MAFTVRDFQDMLHLLETHPEWQEAMRRALLQDDFLQLPRIVRELTEAQKRTEQQVKELAEAQKRSEQRLNRLEAVVAELAEAQKRTEQQVDNLEIKVDNLEVKVDNLGVKVENLGVAFGQLQHAFGATVEEEAASVVEVVLRRKGYQTVRPAFSLSFNGEIDVILPVRDADGQILWVLVEAKARLSGRDVHDWAQRVRSEGWHARLAEIGCTGPYLAYAYSIRTDLAAQEEAEKEGIGLLKSDGELLPPGEPIQPVGKEN